MRTSGITKRSLLAAPAILLLPRKRALAWTHGCLTCGFPGQSGNPVGFQAADGFNTGANPNGAGNLSAPISTPTFAANQPGGVIQSGTPGNPKTYSFIDFDGAGGNNSISSDGQDHNGGFPIHDVTFYGCRFQGSAFRSGYDVECWKNDSYNIAFRYCSFTPRRTAGPWYSKVISPAVLAPTSNSWPASSVGTGIVDLGGGISPINGGTGGGLYQVPNLSAVSFGLALGSTSVVGTYMIVDHCDFWGNQFGITVGTFGAPSIIPVTITDNWIHDARFPACPAWDPTFNYVADLSGNAFGAYVQGSDNNKYLAILNSGPGFGGAHDPVGDGTGHWVFFDTNDHTNGISFAQGTEPPNWNWLIKHNTIASLGNTRCLGWQSTASHYQNNQMINNYLSGYNDTVDMGTLATGAINTGWVFTDNIFATDLPFVNCTIDHAGSSPNGVHQTQFTTDSGPFVGSGNVWRRNVLKLYPNDTWSGFGGNDGKFVLPENGSIFSSSDWAH